MRRLLNRILYLTETLLTRSPVYQLMLVAAVILALSVGGGLFVHFSNPAAYSNTPEAIWWAFLRLTDPGYLGDDHGLFPRLVSTFLTVAGYVVFLGALVALMTNWLDRSLTFLASGRSPIFEEGHVLIIGWNERLHALIEEVVHTAAGARGREATPAIVVLCDPYQPTMYRDLMQKLDPEVRKQCRVIIRSGNPLEVESLERVDFSHARCIILISSSGPNRSERSLSDITLAKVLMSMKAQAPNPKRVPNVVVEVAYSGNKLLAESVGWSNNTEAIVADDIMGRLFCQAIRFPGISKVYHRLLTDTFGDTISLRPASDLKVTGKTLRDIVDSLEEGIPIGVLREEGRQSSLELINLDRPIDEADQLVLVCSKEARTLGPVAQSPNFDLFAGNEKKVERKILVVGWSTDLMTFLSEMGAYDEEPCQATLLWENERPRDQERLVRLAHTSPSLSLNFAQGTLLDSSELRRTQIQNFDKILLLADQSQKPLVADAENVLRYVLIDRLVKAENLQVELVVELNDEDNRPLLQGLEPDVLMTAEILSHLLAQVSTHRSLMWIYEELFTKGGAELRLRSLLCLPEQGASFAECQAAALAGDSVTLGFLQAGQVRFNPRPEERLTRNDQLILVEMEDK